MAWDQAVLDARQWAESSDLGFAVVAADKEQRRLTLRARCGSFYVTVPEEEGEEWVRKLRVLKLLIKIGVLPVEFSETCAAVSLSLARQVVWSEEEVCVQLLSQSIEYMGQANRTLVEVCVCGR